MDTTIAIDILERNLNEIEDEITTLSTIRSVITTRFNFYNFIQKGRKMGIFSLIYCFRLRRKISELD
ncbi:hypothetical protein ABE099_05490 [Paenibacillus turicensis]|jgi:hypothetical protein|uniref:hypothetical protein n=1 Tax=Paenibacillus turicensis TaxID=160487 RepID=UPI003D2C0F28